MHGGRREGSGRKPGSKATKTVERLKNVANAMAAVEAALPDAFQGDAHAFLIAIYKDPDQALKDRLAAATAAIGYEKPKLASIEGNVKSDVTVTDKRDALTEVMRRFDRLAAAEPTPERSH